MYKVSSKRPVFLNRAAQRKAKFLRILTFAASLIGFSACLIFTVCEIAQPIAALIGGVA